MPPAADPIDFKFRWLNDQGHETGFLRKKGRFDGETISLDGTEIPVVVVIRTDLYDNRMILQAMAGDEPVAIGFAVHKPSARELKTAIDAARSVTWAKLHREKLQEEGRAHAYRDEQCPNCNATVILTDMPRTPQLYCHFCNTLATVDPTVQYPAEERNLKICDECGMFSKPRKFSVFYFYFLLVVYGWHYRTTWRCPACMRGDAWKMFFGNLPFILGVPVALAQLARCYGGSVIGAFAGLDRANIKARKGDPLGALAGYRAILQRVSHSAGVKYNLGLALRQQGDIQRAAEMFRLALDDCTNYVPAYHHLAACYEQLGETEQLAELKRLWGDGEQDEDAEETTAAQS